MKVKLSEVCNITMGQSPDSSSYNQKSDGIPFFQGNADFGTLYPTARTWTTSPKKIAQKDDILISVRAPIGALNYANIECCIGRGLASIKPLKSVYSKYIFYLLKSQKSNLDSQGVGSTFKAIGRKNLEEIEIENLDIETQQRIAHHLDTIQSAIDNKKQQLALLDEVVKSRFIEMFGDPVQNEKGWELRTLPELGEFGRGVSKHRPRNAPELLGGKYPLIQTGDVANANLYITSYESTYSEEGLKQSKMWKAGTLCITISANIAKTAILTFDSCFPDSIVGFTPNKNTNCLFITYWFLFFQNIIENQALGVAQKNINLQFLSQIKIINPPLSLQNEFSSFVQQIDKSKFVVKQQLADLQELLDSKMQEYFG